MATNEIIGGIKMDAKKAFEIAKAIPRTDELVITISAFYKENGEIEHILVFNHGVEEESDNTEVIDGVSVNVIGIQREEEQ